MSYACNSGARISVSDGTLTILAKNQSVMEKVQEKVAFYVLPVFKYSIEYISCSFLIL